MLWRSLKTTGSSLLLAFSAVAISFVAATVYSQRSTSRLHEAALDLSDNVAPSIAELAAARDELSHLRDLAAELADPPGHPSDHRPRDPQARPVLAALAGRRQAFAHHLDTCFALPITSPDERALWDGLRRSWTRLDLALSHLVQAASAPAAAEASDLQMLSAVRQREVEPAMTEVAEALYRVIAANAQEARALARHIDGIRQRSLRSAALLDLLSILFAGLAALLSVRAVRQGMAALDERFRLEAARSAELEIFAGRVAHDIRGSLSAALLAIEYNLRSGRLDEKANSTLTRGQVSLQRASRILSGLLAFACAGARPKPGARADLPGVVDDVVAGLRPAAEAENIALVIEPIPRCAAACDPGILTSVLSNLVGNAIKYMGDSATRQITVRVRAPEPPSRMIRMEIADTGPGLPPGTEEHIFEPFFRGGDRVQPGVGLGLATVLRICESHGGRVGVFTQPPRSGEGGEPPSGCTFWVDLPAT